MPKQKWECNVCSKQFTKKTEATICEEAHSYTKKQVKDERDTPVHNDVSSVKMSHRTSTSKADGNWHSNYPDAHGWHHSSTPSWD